MACLRGVHVGLKSSRPKDSVLEGLSSNDRDIEIGSTYISRIAIGLAFETGFYFESGPLESWEALISRNLKIQT